MLAYCIIWILWPFIMPFSNAKRKTAQHAIRCTLSPRRMSCGMLKLSHICVFDANLLGEWTKWTFYRFGWYSFQSYLLWMQSAQKCYELKFFGICLQNLWIVYFFLLEWSSNTAPMKIMIQNVVRQRDLFGNRCACEIIGDLFFYSWWCWSCTRLTGSCARCTVKICNQHRYSTLSVVVVVFLVSLSRSHSLCVYFFYIHCAWFLFDVPCKTGFGK